MELIITLIAYLLVAVIRKYFSKIIGDKRSLTFVFSAVCSIVSAIVLILWGGVGKVSTYTLIVALVFGMVTALQFITNIKALSIGPLSYTMLITSFSSLIPTLSGAVLFSEKIELIQIIGILFMLVSFILSIEKKSTEKGTSFKWLFFCLISFLCTGAIGVMQKIHQNSNYASELNGFLIIAFLTSFIFSSTFAFIFYKKDNLTLTKEKSNRTYIIKLILLVLICGVGIAVNNKINLYLSGVMDSAVLFPILNGGGLVLTTLASFIIFKENLTKKQWFGIIIGITSVILLCNPF